jgi:UTP-glucose-1-phosphate uridylyltransferase/mevalonate kinase
MEKEYDIFVPGRICLFGEHSDWAGGYRRINSRVDPGFAIICGTNQGLHARIQKHPDSLVFRSSFEEQGQRQEFRLPMNIDALLEEARKGSFFSYVAGVAYQILTHYAVSGLVIDNYKTDLPVKKGLSSSAAVCVMVARAFNLAYDLKMTVRGEMEYAYRGEITTPSRCGRLDQGCAYGSRPVMMRFDGDTLDVSEVPVGADLYLIIADLKAGKDTVKILSDLNKAYPFAETEVARGVQEYLGPINRRILEEASEAIRLGDPQRLGALMKEAQTLFDRYLGPACPSQLTAPVLHRVLSYAPLGPYIYGGKGVGSQGDGTVQFLARDAESRERAIEILERDLGLSCLRLTVPRTRKVRKGVITAAGFGTRLFPMTSAVRKEFLPVVDPKGRMIPLILANVEEALAAGIEELCIIIQDSDRRLFEDFFRQNLPPEHYAKLSIQAKEQFNGIRKIGQRITFRTQTEQRGLGHAVFMVRDWVGNEPFLLILGDHLFVPRGPVPCAKQLVDRYQDLETNLIGLQPTAASEIHRFGTVGGSWVFDQAEAAGEGRDLLEITEFKEKPDVNYAQEYLAIDGLGSDTFLTVFGLYLLKPSIFEELERLTEAAPSSCGEEVQLTDALEGLLKKERFLGLTIRGEKIDIGLPSGYLDGIAKFSGRS